MGEWACVSRRGRGRKASSTPVLIKSDTQVDKLEKKGMLTERATSIRLNCPIIKVGKK